MLETPLTAVIGAFSAQNEFRQGLFGGNWPGATLAPCIYPTGSSPRRELFSRIKPVKAHGTACKGILKPLSRANREARQLPTYCAFSGTTHVAIRRDRDQG